jgi:hypothetical protein
VVFDTYKCVGGAEIDTDVLRHPIAEKTFKNGHGNEKMGKRKK